MPSLQLHAVGIGRVAVAELGAALEIGGGLGEIRLGIAVDLDGEHAEIVERGRVVLRRRLLEILRRAGPVPRHAGDSVEQHDAMFELRPRVAEIGGEPEPALGFDEILLHRKAVAVELADQRHRGGVLGVFADALARLAQSDDEIAALIGAESEIGLGAAGRRRPGRVGLHDSRPRRDHRAR